MGLQFHETMYGKNFFEHQLPRLTKAIEKLADQNNKQVSGFGGVTSVMPLF